MKKIINYVLVIMTLVSFNVLAVLPPPKDTGLPLHSKVPELSAVDIFNNKQTLKQLSGDKGLVLIFFRSADWCSYCKKHLVEMNDWNDKFNELGYKFAAISYDDTNTLRKFSNKKHLKFPLLSDQNHQTIKTYNVLNTEQKEGSEHYGIPFPGVMIIDPNGNLAYKYFYLGYKKRVIIKDLYKTLSQN